MRNCRMYRFGLASAAKTLRHKTTSRIPSSFLYLFQMCLSLTAFHPASGWRTNRFSVFMSDELLVDVPRSSATDIMSCFHGHGICGEHIMAQGKSVLPSFLRGWCGHVKKLLPMGCV